MPAKPVLEQRTIDSFVSLGHFLSQFSGGQELAGLEKLNERHYVAFNELIDTEHIHNPWFTRENILQALDGLALMLDRESLLQWLRPYKLSEKFLAAPKTIGVVMAGNIPLVGFHDLLCVLLSGHRLLAKTSSKDQHLIKALAAVLTDIDPELGERIEITEDKLSGMDAVIATGSNNSARYFEQYFSHLPHIIRKNRNGVAILNGNETKDELMGLGRDIFSYFGMGCRNVTKLFIPEDYDLTTLLKVMDNFEDMPQHHKYMNNVAYYRSIYLMNQVAFLDNGFLLLKEDEAIASPVGVVFYERYSELEALVSRIEDKGGDIQCVVATNKNIPGAIPPGSTQQPMPWDYADGVDTLRFLKELK